MKKKKKKKKKKNKNISQVFCNETLLIIFK